MNRFFKLTLAAIILAILPSCADHDDPQLSPIDTTQVKITASVTDAPNTSWLTVTEEMTINVSNVEMKAPKGVVLRSISLIASNGLATHTIDDKPFSGEPLVFKVPLTGKQGRFNFSLRGNLIKKDSRDAEIIIADNIQKIIFSEQPEWECEGRMSVSVKSKSTTGEEYSHSFDVTSSDHFTIPVPDSQLYWTPASGTATTLEVTLNGNAEAWSPNTTFNSAISSISIGHSSGDNSTRTFTIANTPGSLNAEKLQLYVIPSFYGTWENVSIDPFTILYVFNIIEAE